MLDWKRQVASTIIRIVGRMIPRMVEAGSPGMDERVVLRMDSGAV
jgi:hypothetical protein